MYKLTALLIISYSQVADSALRGGAQQSNNVSSSSLDKKSNRSLQQVKAVSGECTVANFASAVGGKGTLASWLSSANDDAAMQQVLDTKCANALDPQM